MVSRGRRNPASLRSHYQVVAFVGVHVATFTSSIHIHNCFGDIYTTMLASSLRLASCASLRLCRRCISTQPSSTFLARPVLRRWRASSRELRASFATVSSQKYAEKSRTDEYVEKLTELYAPSPNDTVY